MVHGDREACFNHDASKDVDTKAHKTQVGEYADYLLSRDMIRRQIRPPPRCAQVDFIAFVLNISNPIELDGPTSYEDT